MNHSVSFPHPHALLLFVCVCLLTVCCFCSSSSSSSTFLSPTVAVVILARNKEHTLPYYLAYLEDLDYPKDRMTILIRLSNGNVDETPEILRKWTRRVRDSYHFVEVIIDDFTDDEEKITPVVGWSERRLRHMIHLRENSLNRARDLWADFVWFLDCDAFITDNRTLRVLTEKEYVVSAPLLTSLGQYSNFWAGMGEDFYYQRTEEYEPILERKNKGCHSVKMIHSAVLINLRTVESRLLTYKPDKILDYYGPEDDIIAFAISAHWNDIPLIVCNDLAYGHIMLPLDEDGSTLEDDFDNLVQLRLEMMVDRYDPLPFLPEFAKYIRPYPPKDRLNMDQVYMINLERRANRRNRMENCFDELGILAEWVKAVDGKDLTPDYMKSNGIQMMSDFSEPYHQRPLKYGEIGCFMSHYNIWLDVLKNKYDKVIVFEDDIRFAPYFRYKLSALMRELEYLQIDWDLVFLGRKILASSDEPWVEGSEMLVHVGYTYWTLCYVLTYEGARKLIDEKPLGKMVPVDEYLPIMFNRHPNETWMKHYVNRNLKAFSVHPLLVHPTHYTGEEGYISDTEDTLPIKDEL